MEKSFFFILIAKTWDCVNWFPATKKSNKFYKKTIEYELNLDFQSASVIKSRKKNRFHKKYEVENINNK